VRMRERNATLCWRFFSAWRARFADCLLFATWCSSASWRRAVCPGRRAFWAFGGRMSIEPVTCSEAGSVLLQSSLDCRRNASIPALFVPETPGGAL
jgi:hypothetical protein